MALPNTPILQTTIVLHKQQKNSVLCMSVLFLFGAYSIRVCFSARQIEPDTVMCQMEPDAVRQNLRVPQPMVSSKHRKTNITIPSDLTHYVIFYKFNVVSQIFGKKTCRQDSGLLQLAECFLVGRLQADREWASFGSMLNHNMPFSDCHSVCLLFQLEIILCQLEKS